MSTVLALEAHNTYEKIECMLAIIISLDNDTLAGLLEVYPKTHLFYPEIPPRPWYHCTHELHPPQEEKEKHLNRK